MAKRLKSCLTDDMEHCIECKREVMQRHHIFGGYRRKHSEEDNFILPLCWECHAKIHCDNSLKEYWMREAQKKWEETRPREEFRLRYGKSYL